MISRIREMASCLSIAAPRQAAAPRTGFLGFFPASAIASR
jgi:hypothetical protein